MEALFDYFSLGLFPLQQIHALIMSLNFTAIEIKTINSLDSWNGGILVMVSGSVKAKDFGVRRNFIQTFFLAPQEKGYFVHSDIFQYINDETIYQHPTPELPESKFDSQLNVSSPHPEPPGDFNNRLLIEIKVSCMTWVVVP